MTTLTIAGRVYDLDPARVKQAVSDELPEPIHQHFVVIGGRRWPPEQVLSLVTGLDKADITASQARQALIHLGFVAAQAVTGETRPPHSELNGAQGPDTHSSVQQPLVEALRPFIGQWVAVRGDDVLVAADSLKDVVSWLRRHQQKAQSVFRVPYSEEEISGAGPQ